MSFRLSREAWNGQSASSDVLQVHQSSEGKFGEEFHLQVCQVHLN